MILPLILIVIITMSVSFFCSLLEASLLSLSILDLAKITEKHPHIGAIWQHFKKDIEKPISVILIINTLSQTIGATLAGAQFDAAFGTRWIALFSIFYSYAMLQWAELLPKSLGIRYNINIAKISAVPMNFMVRLFTPILKLVLLVNKPFEGKNKSGNKLDALEEITYLARFALVNNKINTDQEKILEKTVKLSKLAVKSIMVKKSEMKVLNTSMSLTDALIEAHVHHHTRFPLIDNATGMITGYVNFKDIVASLQFNPQNPSLDGIKRPVLFLDENENLSSVLSRLIKSYQHIAVVKNSSGEVTGVITMEDVIESIVGKIGDEYDILPKYIFNINDNRLLIGGGTSMNEVFERLGLKPEPDNAETTICEYLLKFTGPSPKNEARVRAGHVNFIVRKVRRSKIHEIIAEIYPQGHD